MVSKTVLESLKSSLSKLRFQNHLWSASHIEVAWLIGGVLILVSL